MKPYVTLLAIFYEITLLQLYIQIIQRSEYIYWLLQEKRTEAMLIVGPKCAISVVTNIKNNTVSIAVIHVLKRQRNSPISLDKGHILIWIIVINNSFLEEVKPNRHTEGLTLQWSISLTHPYIAWDQWYGRLHLHSQEDEWNRSTTAVSVCLYVCSDILTGKLFLCIQLIFIFI